MSERTVTVSVIISAYSWQRWENLCLAIASLGRQTRPPDEVIVVIDHNPELYELAKRTFTGAVVMENIEASSAAGARNSGVARSEADIVAFLDDDAEADPDWLAQLVAGYSGAGVVGVGGHIHPKWNGRRPAWFPSEFDWVVGCSYTGIPTEPTAVRNMIGCNMSFLRSALIQAGGFTAGFGRIGLLFMGSEDEETETCIRVGRAHPDGRILHWPQAAVHHCVPENRTRFAYFARRCYSEGLSKAQLKKAYGSVDGLSTERTYVMKALPAGVLRGIVDTMHGQFVGLARSAAIVAGLAITGAGYLAGCWSRPKGVHVLQASPEVGLS